MTKCLPVKSTVMSTKRFLFKIYFMSTPPKPGQWNQNRIKLLLRKWTVPQLQIGPGCCCFTPIYTLFRQLFQVMALSSMEFNKVTGFPPTPRRLFSIIHLTAGDHYPVKQHSISSASPLRGNVQRVCTNRCVSKFSLLIGSFFIRYLFREVKS